jgi:low temperature requirement protein LtrA
MFVAVIAQLSVFLSEHVTTPGITQYVLLFVPVWWVWIGGNFYTERFETEDLSQRVFTFLQMLPLATLAASVHEGFGRTADAFGWSYIAARSVILFLWVRAGWHNPVARPMTDRFALGFAISIACWFLSLGRPLPEAMFLRGLGLFLDLATPFTTFRQQESLPRFSTSRLPERFGLFVVMVLGEAVVAVVAGASKLPELGAHAVVTMTLTLLVVFAIWWVYFEQVYGRRTRPPFARQALWGYFHMPLVVATVAFAAGVVKAMANEGAGPDAATRWLIAGSLATVFASLGLIESTLESRSALDRSPWKRAFVRFTAAAAVLALGPAWLPGGAPALMTGALFCMVGQVYDGWFLRLRCASAAGAEPEAASGI